MRHTGTARVAAVHEAGDLPGPTIYTAGEFINEPRVNSPDEFQAEIVAEPRAEYDLVKFHEVWTPGVGYLTTTGLPIVACEALNRAARDAGMPLVGHAPVNLGSTRCWGHHRLWRTVGTLSHIYFLPLASNRTWLFVSASAFV